MKLYLLRREDHGIPFDKSHGFVIRASSPRAARTLASRLHGDEGSAVWLDAKATTCRVVRESGETEIVLQHFR